MATEAQQLEFAVRRWVDLVLAGHRIEDSIVECKSEWPQDHRKAARQLAALANTARGADVAWLIGLDEDKRALTRPDDTDPAQWWQQTAKYFDQTPPDLKVHLVVHVGEHDAVVALKFGTERAPYVHLTGSSGGVEREIPWRDGTRTRSARRDEIALLLAPLVAAPEVELLNAGASARWSKKESRDPDSPMHFTLTASTTLIFRPTTPESSLLLSRDVSGRVDLALRSDEPPFFTRDLYATNFGETVEGGSIRRVHSGVQIAGPGLATVWLVANPWGEDWGPERSPESFLPQAHHLTFELQLRFHGTHHPQTLTTTLTLDLSRDRIPGHVRWIRPE